MWNKWLIVAIFASGAGCTHASPARFSDRGVAAHKEAARHHEAAAQALSELTTATAKKQVKMHWQRATEHFAVARDLQMSELDACAGLSESEREMSPFAHRADIEGVDPLYEGFSLRQGGAKEVGAAVLLRPTAGMNTQTLQRIVDCHIAHHAVLGPDLPRESRCPLMLPGVVATVSSTAGVLAIAMRADKEETAHELSRRAAALMYATPQLAKAASVRPAAASPQSAL